MFTYIEIQIFITNERKCRLKYVLYIIIMEKNNNNKLGQNIEKYIR